VCVLGRMRAMISSFRSCRYVPIPIIVRVPSLLLRARGPLMRAHNSRICVNDVPRVVIVQIYKTVDLFNCRRDPRAIYFRCYTGLYATSRKKSRFWRTETRRHHATLILYRNFVKTISIDIQSRRRGRHPKPTWVPSAFPRTTY
jgi:hypothetical protein